MGDKVWLQNFQSKGGNEFRYCGFCWERNFWEKLRMRSRIWLSKRCSERDEGGFSHTPELRFTFYRPRILNAWQILLWTCTLFLFSSKNVVIKAVVFVIVAIFNLFYWIWPFSASFFFARPIVVLFLDWVNPHKLVSVAISLLKNTRFLQAIIAIFTIVDKYRDCVSECPKWPTETSFR